MKFSPRLILALLGGALRRARVDPDGNGHGKLSGRS